MQRYELKLWADYFQFYIQDEKVTGDLSEFWDDDAVNRMLALANGTIGIGTARNTFVPVVIEILDSEPIEKNSEDYDKVNECSIEIDSGIIVVAGCTDYFPDAKRIAVHKGVYRARVYYHGLNEINEDGLEGEDRYRISLWLDTIYRPIVSLK